VELIVVIGIIAILAGLLLPAVNHMRRSAQIIGQKADFQTIASALEQYKADFGDYPRNAALPTTNTVGGAVHAPIFLSLATALMGPGPGMTQQPGITSISQYEIGDGADGLGFRGQSMNIPVSISSPNFTSSPPTVTVSPVPPQLSNFVQGQTVASMTLSVGTQYEETVGIYSFTATQNQLTLAAGLVFPTNHQTLDKYLIKFATGKITPNYLSADTFKVAFVPAVGMDTNYGLGGPGSNFPGSAGQPVLLDRWGQVIQYFPRYGPANNRTNDSVLYSNTPAAQAGPLFGYSQPKSVDTGGAGENAIWDARDGAPFFAPKYPNLYWNGLGLWPNPNPVTGYFDEVVPWPKQTGVTNAFQPESTIEWMLGDSQTTGSPPTGFTNLIQAPDKLNYDGPYILISAGPDGPERNNGGYCSFVNPATGTLTDSNGNNLTSTQLLQMFTASGNIYNFDRP
jgi:type II secretory pathway pseudopilin PulG